MQHRVAARDEVQPGKILAVKVGAEELALYEIDGEVIASDDVCPHSYCLLSENADIVGDGEIECSCHGSRFDLRSGENINPPSSDPLPLFAVEVRDGDVFVEVE